MPKHDTDFPDSFYDKIFKQEAKPVPAPLTPVEILHQMYLQAERYKPQEKWYIIHVANDGKRARFVEQKPIIIDPPVKYEYLSTTGDLLVLWLLEDKIDCGVAYMLALQIAARLGWEIDVEMV